MLNPNHFYVRYVAEHREAAMLSQKINQLSSRPSSFFSPGDMLETGMLCFLFVLYWIDILSKGHFITQMFFYSFYSTTFLQCPIAA